MNILISSTLHWNPGDEWIMHGCQNIIREALPAQTQLNWIVYNRNVDLMEGRKGYSKPTSTVGNYVTTSVPYEFIDLFVQAGSPEWHGPPAEAFHAAILKTDKPYIMMGIGSTNSTPPMTELDVKVMMRSNTYIYTRSIATANAINSRLGVEKAQALPCPAICVMLGHSQKSREMVQIPQTPSGPQSVRPEYLVGLSSVKPTVAETIREWYYYTGKGHNVEYVGSASGTLSNIARYTRVVTTRLHGAIAAMATGSAVVLVGRGDYRIETAAEMFSIPVVGSFEEAKKVKGAIDKDFKIKYNVLNEYKSIIQGALSE